MLLASCSRIDVPRPLVAVRPSPKPAVRIAASGDIADCNLQSDEKTSSLLDGFEGQILLLGDTVYEVGAIATFRACFEPAWGRHLSKIRPAPGNHEYGDRGAAGYFQYFGAAAGPARLGYYSFDLEDWHLISLNSNCHQVACGEGSEQLEWLKKDLAQHRTTCTLAYWHHPRFSSGLHGSDVEMAAIWNALQAARADVALSGHDHSYERLTRLGPNGEPDSNGIRQFVAGTGGRTLYPILGSLRGSEARDHSTFGVLFLTLKPTSYQWTFTPASPGTFIDSGEDSCVI